MKKSLKLIQAGFESSSETTEEFKKFFKVFKKEMTEILNKFSAKLDKIIEVITKNS